MPRSPQNRDRLTRHVCPVCGRTEVQDVEAWKATQILVDNGWQWTTKVTDPSDTWHLVCPKHYRSSDSRTILADAETDPQRVELPLK
jgi:hypothetical protein